MFLWCVETARRRTTAASWSPAGWALAGRGAWRTRSTDQAARDPGTGLHQPQGRLCARFRDINPRTEFDLECSHKWMQGQAKPRSFRVLPGLGAASGHGAPALLADRLHGGCVRRGGVPGFAADRFGTEAASGPRRTAPRKRRAGVAAAVHYLCGAYAAYSHAWSPYFRDQLIRGSLLIQPGRGSRFSARYRKACVRAGRAEGVANLVGRVLHINCTRPAAARPSTLRRFCRVGPPACCAGSPRAPP